VLRGRRMTKERFATQPADLTRFLFEAKDHGYADIQRVRPTAERDHSLTMDYESGDWRFHDNFFGGEPYGGRAVVFVKGRPLWMMVYYGWVDGTDADIQPVYTFLQAALRQAPAELPLRGPEEFSDGRFTYRMAVHGTVENFWGEETIHRDGRQVYVARFAGGLVDRRRGE
jgi:Domain of unknown function (DUF5680)